MVDDFGYSRNHDSAARVRPLFKVKRRTLIFGGVGILLLIVLTVLFFRGGSELTTKDLAALQVRVDLLEKRLTRLEQAEMKLAKLEKQGKGLQQFVRDVKRSGEFLGLRLDKLTQKIDVLENSLASVPARSKAPYAVQRRPLSLGKRRTYEVRSGDTLYKIAQKYGISVEELCRLNEISPDQIIYPGQKLLVVPAATQ